MKLKKKRDISLVSACDSYEERRARGLRRNVLSLVLRDCQGSREEETIMQFLSNEIFFYRSYQPQASIPFHFSLPHHSVSSRFLQTSDVNLLLWRVVSRFRSSSCCPVTKVYHLLTSVLFVDIDPSMSLAINKNSREI